MKTSRLTNRHFKSRNIQKFHKFFFDRWERKQWEKISHGENDVGDGALWAFITFSMLYFMGDDFFGMESKNEFIRFIMFIAFAPVPLYPAYGRIVKKLFKLFFQKILNFLYKIPAGTAISRMVVLINPHGNPEMCKITKYPAFDFYGYRLPNAGDIEKVEKLIRKKD
tara:strand:+ start:310 stop:810 length:501 start_codon:yes stop_codon:yes gene_type:complete